MMDRNEVSGRSKPAAAAGPGLLEGDDEVEFSVFRLGYVLFDLFVGQRFRRLVD